MELNHARRPRRRRHAYACTLFSTVLGLLGAASPAQAEEGAGSLGFQLSDNATSGDVDCSAEKKNPSAGVPVDTLERLAHCHVQSGRLLKARELLRSVMAELPAGDPLRDLVGVELARLEERIPQVTLRPVAGVGEVSVLDGPRVVPRGALGTPVDMDPGVHRFT